jgi:hypothetical protein
MSEKLQHELMTAFVLDFNTDCDGNLSTDELVHLTNDIEDMHLSVSYC